MKTMENSNSFGAAATLKVRDAITHSSTGIPRQSRDREHSPMPLSIRILLENLLRFEDDRSVRSPDIEYVAKWESNRKAREIQFRPARVLLQDFTGVPAVVDLAAMRDALAAMGADPKLANPLIPADLVIDHSVRSIISARAMPSGSTRCSSSSATRSAMRCSAGVRRRSRISAWFRPIRASSIR